VARHHREAGRAAVHLVQLVNVRESANPLRRLRESFAGELVLLLFHLPFFDGCLDLIRPDGFVQTHVGGQDLFGEVERDVRDLAEVVLADTLFDLLSELGHAA
jgi:hypothetical protein